jgi:hypothetical protein
MNTKHIRGKQISTAIPCTLHIATPPGLKMECHVFLSKTPASERLMASHGFGSRIKPYFKKQKRS